MNSGTAVEKKRNVLVIVGRAVAGPELVGALTPRAAELSTGFTLLVPAAPNPQRCEKQTAYGGNSQRTEAAAWADAVHRAEAAGAALRDAGLEVIETIVGDPDFAAAAGDVLHSREIDEVVVLVDPNAALGAAPDLVAV